ncbi:MAG: FliH/SctL family protein, partial [Bacilli bacterium]
REEWSKAVNQEIEIKIVPDRKVSYGGCIIRSEEGTIDAEVEVQLSNVKEELMSIAMGSDSNGTAD